MTNEQIRLLKVGIFAFAGAVHLVAFLFGGYWLFAAVGATLTLLAVMHITGLWGKLGEAGRQK